MKIYNLKPVLFSQSAQGYNSRNFTTYSSNNNKLENNEFEVDPELEANKLK
jgi:hypothetical protein